MKRFIGYIVATSLLALGSIGFGSAQAQGSGLPQEMIGVTWELVAIERAGQSAENVAGAGLTLEFIDGARLGGFGGCNGFGSDYKAGPGQRLDLEGIISTLIACLEVGVMEREGRYFSALDGVTSYDLNGDTLTLAYSAGNEQGVLRYAKGGPGSSQPPGMPRTGDGSDIMPFLALSTVGLLAGLLLRHTRRSGVRA